MEIVQCGEEALLCRGLYSLVYILSTLRLGVAVYAVYGMVKHITVWMIDNVELLWLF